MVTFMLAVIDNKYQGWIADFEATRAEMEHWIFSLLILIRDSIQRFFTYLIIWLSTDVNH